MRTRTSLYSIPGKVILLGEYAVLTRLPALVAAIGPRFELEVTSGDPESNSKEVTTGRPGSPLERLQSWAKEKKWPELSFRIKDPHRCAGGFGASTAEFALAYQAYGDAMELLTRTRDWKQGLALYRELMSTEPLVPSGADLVAQWQGGVTHFNPAQSTCTDVSKNFDWSCILVFSATQIKGRKVPTHQHLDLLSKQGFPQSHSHLLESLARITEEGVGAVTQGDPKKLGQALDAYAECLRKVDLEIPAAYEDRKVLREFSGVLGVKGAGALQSDVLLVVIDETGSNRSKVVEAAEKRGLILVQDGIICQDGLMEQK